MVSKKYDWVNDEDVRWNLSAEAVIILFNERTMKTLNFSTFAQYRNLNWKDFPNHYEKLVSHQKCLETAVSQAHKNRFGCNMKKGTDQELDDLYDLILRVYSYYKNNGTEKEIILK